MKLILTHEVDGLGAPGDIVEVKDGYGRNFLIPRGFGIRWTRGGERQIDSIKQARSARAVADLGKAQEIKAKLEGSEVAGPGPCRRGWPPVRRRHRLRHRRRDQQRRRRLLGRRRQASRHGRQPDQVARQPRRDRQGPRRARGDRQPERRPRLRLRPPGTRRTTTRVTLVVARVACVPGASGDHAWRSGPVSVGRARPASPAGSGRPGRRGRRPASRRPAPCG